MNRNPSYRVFAYTLQPGQEHTIHHVVAEVACLEASAPFRVAFGGGPLTDFEQGLSFRASEAFSVTRIHNDSAAPVYVRMGMASGGVGDSRLSLTGVAQFTAVGDTSTKEVVPDALANSGVNAAATGRTLIAAENTDRVEVILSNLGPSAVFLGGDDVDAGEGLPLASGKAATLTTTAAIYAYNQTTTATPIAVLETTR